MTWQVKFSAAMTARIYLFGGVSIRIEAVFMPAHIVTRGRRMNIGASGRELISSRRSSSLVLAELCEQERALRRVLELLERLALEE